METKEADIGLDDWMKKLENEKLVDHVCGFINLLDGNPRRWLR